MLGPIGVLGSPEELAAWENDPAQMRAQKNRRVMLDFQKILDDSRNGWVDGQRQARLLYCIMGQLVIVLSFSPTDGVQQ